MSSNGTESTAITGSSIDVDVPGTTVNASNAVVNVAYSGGAVTVIGNLDSVGVSGANDTVGIDGVGNALAASNNIIEIWGSNDSVNGSGDNIILSSNEIVTSPGGYLPIPLVNGTATVVGSGNTIGQSEGDDIGSNWSGTINVIGSNNSVTASGDSINLSGGGNSVTGSDNIVNVALSNGTVTFSQDTNSYSSEDDNTINVNGTGDSVYINGSGDTVNASNASIYLGTGDTVTVNGTGDTVVYGSEPGGGDGGYGGDGDGGGYGGYAVSQLVSASGSDIGLIASSDLSVGSLAATASTINIGASGNTVNASGETLNIMFSNGAVIVIGSLDSIVVSGTNDTIDIDGTGDVLAASNGLIDIAGSNDTVTGSGDNITLFSNQIVASPDGSWEPTPIDNGIATVIGSGNAISQVDADVVDFNWNGTIKIVGSNNSIEAWNDTINISGSGNSVTGAANVVNVALSNGTVTFNQDPNPYISQDDNIITVTGTGDAIYINESGDIVNASNATIYVGSGDTVTVNGTGDTIINAPPPGEGGDGGYGGGDGGGGGGYDFAQGTKALGTDIGLIARYDLSVGNLPAAQAADAARQQANEALLAPGSTADPIAVAEGAKWASHVVTWSLATANASGRETFSGSLGSQNQAVVEQAFQAWAAASGLTFVEVPDSASSDIRLGWGNFDTGSSGVLGFTSYQSQNGQFQPGTTIQIENPADDPLVPSPDGQLTYAGTPADLYQVVLHEIGHALGLADDSDTRSVMAAVSGPDNPMLDCTDISGIQALYGGSPTGTGAAIADPSLVVSNKLANLLVQAMGSFGAETGPTRISQPSSVHEAMATTLASPLSGS